MNNIINSLSAWFGRLSYQQKFNVISVIFFIPVIAFFPLIGNEARRIERYGSEELFGTIYIRPLWRIQNDLQVHQLVSASFFSGNAEIAEIEEIQNVVDSDFETLAFVESQEILSEPYRSETEAIRAGWLEIKNSVLNSDPSALQGMHQALHDRISNLMSRVADETQLVLDPDLDTYYLMDTVVFQMPENQNLTFEMHQTVAGITLAGPSPAEKEKLASLIGNIESSMAQIDRNVSVALANNTNGNMEPLIAGPFATYQSEMQAYLQFLQNEVIGAVGTTSTSALLENNRLNYEKIHGANQTFYTAASGTLQEGVSARVNSLILSFYPTTIIVLASLAGAYLLGQSLMQSISQPIVRLITASQQLASGDLSARVSAEGGDELGKVANALNKMAGDIEAEQAVLTTRAHELEIANQINESRARDLLSINEISRIISSEQRLDILLPLISRLVSDKFNFYHTGIFLVDDNRLFAVLQAANSEGGQRMLNRGHRLELGTGIVGTVALTGKPRTALDVGADAVFFDNPDLPTTRSEMALPLKVGGETIGVLDVQSTRSGEFNENDVNILGILAEQIAIAIENTRLFTKTQQALDEVQALYNQYLQKEWKALQGKTQNVGYMQSLSGGKPLMVPVETDDIRHAVRTGQTLISRSNDGMTDPTVIVPIKLRGRIIGVLNIKSAARDREWTRDELNLIQSVTDRLALALENARLFEETSRRAERERLVSEITGKIRSVNDSQSMIKTAVEELRNALGASRVQIIPQTLADADKTVE